LILSRRNPNDRQQDSQQNSDTVITPTHVLQNGLAIALERFQAQDNLQFTLSKITATEQWQISPNRIALSINQKAATSIQTLKAGDTVHVGRETFQFIRVS
ncbi:MAG: hypothetical protein ACPH09_03785, partial [Pseudomonadales bacterium]